LKPGWHGLRGDLAKAGYTQGVLMGADLKAAPAGKPAAFLIAAPNDPEGANLDRVPIIKGWLAADGTTQERLHDIKWAGDRKPGPDGRLPPLGNTVDVEEGDLCQQHWCRNLDGTVDRSGLRLEAEGGLFHARSRNPGARLECV
jgi:hypothetical protein